MSKNLELILDLQKQAEKLEYRDGDKDHMMKRINMIIKKIFGGDSDYLNEVKRIKWAPMIFSSNTGDWEFSDAFDSGKKQLLNLIKVMNEDLLLDVVVDSDEKPETDSEILKINKDIFLVHGHNEEMKQSVARALENLGLKPLILHELPNQGKTIIEKFMHYSEVGFAIILLSADDIAYPKSDEGKNPQFRARQNVILELGYFLGKLGREKVLALHEENVKLEIPTDYQGVLFVPYDNRGSWKFSVAKELKDVGFEIDVNKLL